MLGSEIRDHFIGFDHLLRVVLRRMERLWLHAGPGFIAQVEHKLSAHCWNVVHLYEVPLTFELTKIDPACARRAHFCSRNALAPWE